MTEKFKANSEESHLWVQYLLRQKCSVHPASEAADAALRAYRARLEVSDVSIDDEVTDVAIDDGPDCTATEHQPFCRHYKTTPENTKKP